MVLRSHWRIARDYHKDPRCRFDLPWSYRAKTGAPFDGGQMFRLRVPSNAPNKQFWAVSIYDIETRALIQNGEKRAEISSQMLGLKINADGSVDVYVGPAAPRGFESDWVKSVPGKAWFAYFRRYR